MTTVAITGSTAPRASATGAQSQAGGTATPVTGTTARPGMRTPMVLCYLALALIALVPGVVLKLGGGGLLEIPLLQELQQGLADIRFGSGLRFWLGVTGATMVALLLLYPLRKVLTNGRILGRIGAWFQIHIVLGLAGPVLILYHCNFGHGSSNANVALWTMLTVAVSGIVGLFVYQSVSAEFYAGKQKARVELDGIVAILERLDAMQPSRRKLIDELTAFEAELLTPRQGVMASITARLGVERRRRRFARLLASHLAHCARQLDLSVAEHDRLRAVVGGHLGAYVRIARYASSRSVREQLWARWRLFHLPVFLIMVAAAILHVVAVWDMDGASKETAATLAAVARKPTASPPPAIAPEIEHAATMPVLPPPEADPVPGLIVKPQLVTRGTFVPSEAQARPSNPKETMRPIPKPASKPIVEPPPAEEPAETSINSVYTELMRRIEPPPMGLGVSKPRTLAEQVSDLKAKQKINQFSHSEAETGFALTGKHLKAECTSCHTKPLQMERSSTQRQCIACHQSDDLHRGRRPDCVKCHTTNRWSEIIRRR